MGTKSPEVATPTVLTMPGDVKTRAVQARSLYRLKVTVPVGRTPPMMVAISRTAVPTGPPGEAAARMATVRLRMVIVNVWQAGVETPFEAHTVVGPNVPAARGEPVRKPAGLTLSPGGTAPLVTAKVSGGA